MPAISQLWHQLRHPLFEANLLQVFKLLLDTAAATVISSNIWISLLLLIPHLERQAGKLDVSQFKVSVTCRGDHIKTHC
jgi:hypothetical protein